MQIDVKLNKDFERYFNHLIEEYGEDFAKLNGLDINQLSLSDFIDNFIDKKTVADASIDSNSNVSHKDIVTLRSEMSKPHEKLLAYNKIFFEAKKKYGLRFAKKWLELEWNRSLYLHDANTSSFLAYCFAYDLKRLAEEGLFYLPDHTYPEPAKHLESFIDFVKEFISYNSNRTSGACGLPNLIPYMYYFFRNDVKNGVHGCKIMNPEKFAKSQIQRFIYSINQPYTRDGIQSAFVNTSVFDSEYFDALFGGMEFPDGTFAIDEKEEIMQFQKWFLEEMATIKDNGKVFTFPVNTVSLLYKGGRFVDEEFARWVSNHNRRWNDSNIFCDNSVNSLSNCCRLKSNIENILYFNSIGGTALKVGSTKVSTISLARIALESNGNKDKFLKILQEKLLVNLKILDVIRDIIKRNVEKGLLPNFQEGLMDFAHLYNTVGLNGIYETMRVFDYIDTDELGNTIYKKEAYEFGKEIFDLLHSQIKEFGKDKDYQINLEQVPGESAAVKFLEADKLLYPSEYIDDLPLYLNQWIPLAVKTTLQERVKICSTFDKYCDGGSILHANIDAPFNNEETAWDMLNYLAKKGITYFAFNSKYSQCDDNHVFYGNICPKCGKESVAQYTRTVGYITKTDSWSKPRKDEFKLRKWHDVNNTGE